MDSPAASLVHIHPELSLLHWARCGVDMALAFGIAPKEACFERGRKWVELTHSPPACPRPLGPGQSPGTAVMEGGREWRLSHRAGRSDLSAQA